MTLVNLTVTLVVCGSMIACPGSDGQEGDATQPSTGTTAPDDGTPTAGDTVDASTSPTSSISSSSTGGTSTTGDETTVAEPTTGDPPAVEGTRVFYVPFVEVGSDDRATGVHSLVIVDGVATPAVAVVEAPTDGWLASPTLPAAGDAVFPVYTGHTGASQGLWLVDVATATAVPVELPPGVMNVHDAHMSRDGTRLLVRAGPEAFPSAATPLMCEVAGTACTLAPIEFAVPPEMYVREVIDASAAEGWIIYKLSKDSASGIEVRRAELDDPASSALVAMFADSTFPLIEFAPDSRTMYFGVGSDANVAVDISTDPPGPTVDMHPGLPVIGQTDLVWNADMTAALVWSGTAYGDLFRISVDGAQIGPLEQFATGDAQVAREDFYFTADGSRALFNSQHESPFQTQFFVAPADAPGEAPERVNAPPMTGADVYDTFLLPDPSHVVYTANPESSDLFYASLDPVGEVVQLDPPDVNVADYCVEGAPDGKIVFWGETAAPRRSLFMTDVGGSEPTAAAEITAELPDGLDVDILCALTPDAAQVLFTVRTAEGKAGLFMVPIAPEVGAPAELSGPGEVVRLFVALPM
jgi:hypothetical protein